MRIASFCVVAALFLGGCADSAPSVSQPQSPVLARGAVVHTPPIPCAKRTIAAENALPGTEAWRVDHPVVQLGAPTPVTRPTPPDEGVFATPTPGTAPAPTTTPRPRPAPTATPRPVPTATPRPAPTVVPTATATTPPAAGAYAPPADDGDADERHTPQQDVSIPIEGFTSPVSANCGERVSIFTSTYAPSYSFAVYRLGWYQGHGARLVFTSPQIKGVVQPHTTFDPATRLVIAPWRNPYVLTIPGTWVSGVYIVKLLTSTGFMHYTFFIVRDDSSTSKLLATLPVLTYQAYNQWGGRSLYFGINSRGDDTREDRAYAISFDRPYDDNAGLSRLAYADYNQIRWMEHMGYDVSYAADVDLDLRGALLKQHRLLVDIGHDEYWSLNMRRNVVAARDAGVSLAFFGADDDYWQVRLKSDALGPDRIIVCYKDAALDPIAKVLPQETTVHFREKPVNLPEDALLGQMYGMIGVGDAALTLAAGASVLGVPNMGPGVRVPGTVGGEVDFVQKTTTAPANVTILASSPTICGSSGCHHSTHIANSTLYTAASGARVFDAGTFQWSWGLDSDSIIHGVPGQDYANAGFQTFTDRLFAYLLHEA
ncbi:MAG TPA: N,N-dimethylformamidase beta subunit family domain-containing protein [Ktedonobacterales bacterium]|nr:N,N-dimethylformamidase beta subunit family domain-containing protein [Ktedonobacterales bacterium]